MNKDNIINLNKGRIQPQAIDLEEAVIGALMIDARAFNQIGDILNSEHFYKDAHKNIVISILEISKNNEPIDLLTVSNQLKQNAKLDLAGGDIYLIQLTQKITSSAHIDTHYKIIQQKYLARKLIANSVLTIENAYDETTDVFELLENCKLSIDNIDREIEFEVISDIKTQCDNISFEPNLNNGSECGIIGFSEKFGKWQKGKMIVIAGRPGMGKSSVIIPDIIHALNQKDNNGNYSETIVLFSLEMTAEEFIQRIISFLTGIYFSEIQQKRLNKQQKELCYYALNWVKSKKLFIEDGEFTIEKIRSVSKKIKEKHGLNRCYIDHMGLIIKPKLLNNNEKIEHISNNIKRLSKILDVPVFALSQLSRECEKRPDRKPMLSDLRDSGSVEQDADMVIFVYRPEYYNFDVFNDDKEPTQNKMELIVAKYRGGVVGSFRTNCYISTQRIGNLSYYEFEVLGQNILKINYQVKEEPVITRIIPEALSFL